LQDLAANQLKWQYCWAQSYAFCYVQKESYKNFWTQTAFNWKLSLTIYGKLSEIL